jgi:hypothetical protein
MYACTPLQVFTHYAYALESQVAFKDHFYGYGGSLLREVLYLLDLYIASCSCADSVWLPNAVWSRAIALMNCNCACQLHPWCTDVDSTQLILLLLLYCHYYCSNSGDHYSRAAYRHYCATTFHGSMVQTLSSGCLQQ